MYPIMTGKHYPTMGGKNNPAIDTGVPDIKLPRFQVEGGVWVWVKHLTLYAEIFQKSELF
jgi:hypothetical protein